MRETVNCPGCQRPLQDGARFCSNCGTSATLSSQPTEIVLTPPHSRGELEGVVLDDSYELLERLGEGGIGTVYRARRLRIGDEVAVKILHARFDPEPGAVERFRREARSAAAVNHPNVVSVHDFRQSQANGTPAYIVMELVRGRSLRELLRLEGRLSHERAVALMRDVCAGVGAAHRQGYVHRDLKPDNVIVEPAPAEGERETAKVVDFGIAKMRDAAAELSLTQTGTVVGTPYYMSPEQCRGEEADERSDVYSLGAMLHEMLAGSPPFVSNSLHGLITKHLTEEPPAFAPQLNVPHALQAACRRALSKDPSQRQPNATALGRELQAALAPRAAGDQLQAHAMTTTPVVPAGPPPSWSAPREQKSGGAKWLVVGLFVLLLGGAGLGLGAFLYLRGFAPERATGGAAPVEAQGGTAATAAPTEGEGSDGRAEPEVASPPTSGRGMKGRWAGTYGPMSQPATLVIEEEGGGKFSGVLEQGATRVAFTGTLDASTRRVTMKETRVLNGEGWSLGENAGELSSDGRMMAGTGSDPFGAQLGMSYQWSFKKR